MVRTVLIPVDFRVASLQTLKGILESRPEEKYRIVLMYAYDPGDSITSLLFYSPSRILEQAMRPGFREALEVLKNHFSGRIEDVEYKLFHGRNIHALEHFLEGSRIDEVCIPQGYTLQPSGQGFDPLYLLKKCDCPIRKIPCNSTGFDSDSLSAIFQ